MPRTVGWRIGTLVTAASVWIWVGWEVLVVAPPFRGPVKALRHAWPGMDGFCEVAPLVGLSAFYIAWVMAKSPRLPDSGRLLPAVVLLLTGLALTIATLAAVGVFKSTILMTAARPDFVERRVVEIVYSLTSWFSRVLLGLFFVVLALGRGEGPPVSERVLRVVVGVALIGMVVATLMIRAADVSDILSIEEQFGVRFEVFLLVRVVATLGVPVLPLGLFLRRR